MKSIIQHVPTHIIMGFLGSGKTTAILNLFQQKPDNERWAVLVNEFGEVGIDGHIYQSHGITVEEIPGGCMCCVQGAPMQVAVNRLLRKTRPDRLLIESSGVGHPSGLIKSLSAEHFSRVIDLKAIIALLDPEKLLDERIKNNDLFQDQLATADILVANKTDVASLEAMEAFADLLQNNHNYLEIAQTSFSEMDIAWLDRERSQRIKIIPKTKQRAGNGLDKTLNWQKISLQFPENKLFDKKAVKQWVLNNKQLRVKGIIKMAHGDFLINADSGVAHFEKISPINESRIQLIGLEINETDKEILQMELEACLIYSSINSSNSI